MSKIKLPNSVELRQKRKALAENSKAANLERLLSVGRSRQSPIIPQASISGRALWTVIAIMTLLACLTLGAVLMVRSTADSWQSDIAREVTIQIVPLENVDMDDALERAVELTRQIDGITGTRIFDWEATARLLEPWLGDALSPGDLPVPRLISVQIDPDSRPDLEVLRTALIQNVPGATLDDHRAWVDRLTSMANTTVIAGFLIFLLVMSATCLTVVFATRGALAGNRQIVEVLHFVGAEDKFIASEFQTHFFALALRGAALGGALALLFFFIVGWWASSSVATPQGDQTAAFFGQFTLSGTGYFFLAIVAAGIAVLTATTARFAVHSYLDSVYELGVGQSNPVRKSGAEVVEPGKKG